MTDTYYNQLQTTLNDLMVEFNDLPPIIEKNPTFLEITEYPHYENVCSNILKFFFDTKQAHKLKDLFLKSLLQSIKKEFSGELITDIVERETQTLDRKRSDLLIFFGNTIVVIEVKIGHGLTNQLGAYKTFIEAKYPNHEYLYVILSRDKIIAEQLPEKLAKDKALINEDAKEGFVPITFDDLFENVKSNLGKNYILNADTKYLTLLLDFIQSIQNFVSQMTESDKKNIEFIQQNQNDINKILSLDSDVKKIVSKTINGLKEEIIMPPNTKQWVWKEYDLVHDVSFTYKDEAQNDKIIVSVDCFFELKGVYIEIWVRKGKFHNNYQFLDKLDLFKGTNDFKFSKTPNSRGYIIWQNTDKYFYEVSSQIPKILNEILPQIKISE